jgi:hypothetical protein
MQLICAKSLLVRWQPRGKAGTAAENSNDAVAYCDPSGSLFNLRLAVPVEVVALRAA